MPRQIIAGANPRWRTIAYPCHAMDCPLVEAEHGHELDLQVARAYHLVGVPDWDRLVEVWLVGQAHAWSRPRSEWDQTRTCAHCSATSGPDAGRCQWQAYVVPVGQTIATAPYTVTASTAGAALAGVMAWDGWGGQVPTRQHAGRPAREPQHETRSVHVRWSGMPMYRDAVTAGDRRWDK